MKNTHKFLKISALAAVLTIITVATTIGAGANSFKPAPAAIKSAPMTQMTPEQVEALVENYFATSETMDPQAYANNFASDGTLEDPVGTPVVQGTAAISAYFGGIVAPFKEVRFKIQEIVPCGNEAAVNWKLHLKTTAGKKILIDGMGTFTFNDQGKLVHVREFWDLQAFLAALQN